MEVAPCAQDVSGHATSLLAYLNLQREQAQFCDCVLTQRQSQGQLYPAHRCVLAACSPVLASVLSSTGVLVELQAPCLSDSVLAPLLDYVYTGALPYTYSQQQYYSLLTAACYLQMDELQEVLRARQQPEVCAAESGDVSSGAEKSTYNTTANTSCDMPSTSCVLTFRRPEETDASSVQNMRTFLERGIHQYSDNVEQFKETQKPSAAMDSITNEVGTGRNSRNHCSRRDAWTLSNASNPCNILESTESSINAGHGRQVSYLTPEHLTLNILTTAEDMSASGKEVQKDRFNPAGTVKPEIWQTGTDNTLARTTENRTGSFSSPHPRCGAVPVICHSSRAAIIQSAEVSAVRPYHSAQASGSSKSAPVSRSASTDNDSIAEGIASKYKNQYEAQSQEYRHNEKHTATQRQDNKDSLNHCTFQDLRYKSSTDRSDVFKQDYSTDIDNFVMQSNGCVDSESSHITDHNDQYARCDSFQNNALNLRGDSVPHNKDWSQELRSKTDCSFDDLSSKQKPPNFFDSNNVPLTTTTEEPVDLRAVVHLPVEDSDTRSDLCPEVEVKQEHSSRFPAETDVQDSHLNLYEPKANWYSNIYGADTSTKDAASGHDDSNHRTKPMECKGDRVNFFPTSLEPERISATELTEPHSNFTMPVDRHIFDDTYNFVGQSYRGHLHYHCLQQEDMQEDVHVSHGGSDHKHSNPNNFDHSDKSSDEEGFESPGHSPLKQHNSSADATDQVLLLDISTRAARYLVSCEHRSDTEEKGETFKRKRNEERSVAAAGMKNIRAMAKFEVERFNMVDTTYWTAKTNDKERNSVVQSSPVVEVIHKGGAVWNASNLKEGENQISTFTHCSPPSMSDSVQASMSSTLSVCMPSALSASMPSNRSAHLSTHAHHPFQCSLCDRSFSQRGSLNRHVRSHLGVRPFPCPRCPMTFSRQYRVIEHMRVHQRCASGNDFQNPPASST